jgi:nitrate reductase gamma subunit
MTAISTVFAALFYFASLVLVVGLGIKISEYARTPAPLKIPTTPAPTTRSGVVLLMLREVTLFQSLFRGNLWTWAFGWLFHASLLLVTIRHLRYFIEPVWGWVAFLQPFGMYAGFTMVLGLAGLWARRLWVERIRYISTLSDHLMLILLLLIGTSGLLMSFVTRTDVVQVKAFFLGLIGMEWQALPGDTALYGHLAFVMCLMLIFPFSKLLHAPGVFFSPSRNQVDNPREQRHTAAWAAQMDKH